MLIDWFTVGAQLLNFLVLVWLMKRFLYQPVLAAIAAREQHIAAGLADAAAHLAAAHALDAALTAKSTAFDQQRATLLAEAVTAAQVQNVALLAQGKAADAAQHARAAAAISADQARLCAAVTLQARDEVLAVVRRAMADLADASLEAAMVRAFLRKLAELDAPARARMASAAAQDPAPEVRSAFVMDANQQAALTVALAAACGVQPKALQFTYTPALVCGIALRLGGWSLAWNLDDYLQGFAARSSSALLAKA
ncbi:F0F1 ATP synthase subunit B [Massilia sp. S19_KUP03_FR1]|uniref:F0F1 ATP synthase subunit B n=1 Tax=Massilia sp. S19_KUP03_FR1 TaxID=3025503 RepID=UPI002FCDBE11